MVVKVEGIPIKLRVVVEVEGIPIGPLSAVSPFPEHSSVEKKFDVADTGCQ